MSVTCIHDKYIISKIIGKGKFGTVCSGIDITNGEPVAIKLEKLGDFSSIKHEVKVMNYLFQNKFRQLPKIYWYGRQEIYSCLVLSYYDCSLLQWCSHKENLQKMNYSVIFNKCIRILSQIHKLFLIHRDIKPHHFMIKNEELFLIDYGLATFTIDINGDPLEDTPQKNIIGTPNYISIFHHQGHKLTFRDDMISLGYMMLFLINGCFPWQEQLDHSIQTKLSSTIDRCFTAPTVTVKPIESIEHPINIDKKHKKKWTSLEPVLKNTKDKLPELYIFLDYCYQLLYNDPPNYDLFLYR